jgi:hypothetical protein
MVEDVVVRVRTGVVVEVVEVVEVVVVGVEGVGVSVTEVEVELPSPLLGKSESTA